MFVPFGDDCRFGAEFRGFGRDARSHQRVFGRVLGMEEAFDFSGDPAEEGIEGHEVALLRV